MAKRIGVVLSGCGYLDGSEIHEATLALLALDRAGAEIVAMAPAVDQADVVDHLRSKPLTERRSVLVESARIARGAVRDLKTVQAGELDGLVFPGGYGAAKNLCTFAKDGAKCRVDPDVTRLVQELHRAGKPMGFICIAPVIAARVLGELGPHLTIGDDAATAAALEALGAHHMAARVDQIVVDEKLKLVSTPAYMLGPTIGKVAIGIDKLVAAVLDLCP